MFTKSLIAFCLVLGCVVIESQAVEDTEFLTEISSKYSPALVKQLFISRIDHKLTTIGNVNGTVGINEDQKNLCSIVSQVLETLRSDVIDMDEQQVICGDETYAKTIKSFISQFDLFISIFETEFENFKTPYLKVKTPDDLYKILMATGPDNSAQVLELALESLRAYIKAMDEIIADEKTGMEIKIIGHAMVSELKSISAKLDERKATAMPVDKKYLELQIIRFKESVDVFYRQVELQSGILLRLF